MNRAELTAKVYDINSKDIESKAAAERIVNSVFDIIEKTVTSGEKVSITDFGSFELVKRAEKKGVNPQTGEPIKIKAKKAVKFTAYTGLKESAAKSKVEI